MTATIGRRRRHDQWGTRTIKGLYTPPMNGVLDDFNTGASQALNARPGWSTTLLYNVGDASLVTDVTPTKAVPSAGTPASNFWGTSFTQNQEAWWTSANTGQSGMLLLRYVSGAGGYGAFVNGGGNHQLQTTGGLVIASGSFPSVAVGDRYGFTLEDDLLAMWRFPNGGLGWQLILSGVSTVIPRRTGSIGFQLDSGNTPQISDFGGGQRPPIVVAPLGNALANMHVVRMVRSGA